MRKAATLLDVVAVVVFVGIGRSVHDHRLDPGGFAWTAWPFACGLFAGWLTLVPSQRQISLRGGAIICLATVAIGMALRVVSGQGIAFAFVVVALGFLGATMVGWRLVVVALHSLRSVRSGS